MKKFWLISTLVLAVTFQIILFVNGCGGSTAGGTASLPLVTPPVKASTPAGLGGTAVSSIILPKKGVEKKARTKFSLDSSDIKSRFFTSGPTDLFFILTAVDNIISGVNGSSGACLTQTPVAYNITPFGQTVQMYGQCYRNGTPSFTGDPAIFQFGVQSNLIYAYSAQAAERVAVIISPLAADGTPVAVPVIYTTGSTAPSASPVATLTPVAGSYQVEGWIGVGYENASASCGGHAYWDGCSYGVIHFVANTVTKAFEMTVAGVGFGYCGAQLKSDGSNIYIAGSTDMGTTCGSLDTLCVAASDAMTPATCGTPLSTFSLPSLGRIATTGVGGTYGASNFPGGASNSVTITGDSTDNLYFGPLTFTTGLGAL